MILFDPETTLEEIRQNYETMQEVGFENISMPFNSLIPLPGEYGKKPDEEGYCKDERAELLQKLMLRTTTFLDDLLNEKYEKAEPREYSLWVGVAKTYQRKLFELSLRKVLERGIRARSEILDTEQELQEKIIRGERTFLEELILDPGLFLK